ncbi:hypothetical protein C8J57DRAFT_1614205 [Mycena rebaudengoi]|nr:hypothetical protein C8J57DRAFT_1614205 [Mycena rebaudengoi]
MTAVLESRYAGFEAGGVTPPCTSTRAVKPSLRPGADAYVACPHLAYTAPASPTPLSLSARLCCVLAYVHGTASAMLLSPHALRSLCTGDERRRGVCGTGCGVRVEWDVARPPPAPACTASSRVQRATVVRSAPAALARRAHHHDPGASLSAVRSRTRESDPTAAACESDPTGAACMLCPSAGDVLFRNPITAQCGACGASSTVIVHRVRLCHRVRSHRSASARSRRVRARGMCTSALLSRCPPRNLPAICSSLGTPHTAPARATHIPLSLRAPSPRSAMARGLLGTPRTSEAGRRGVCVASGVGSACGARAASSSVGVHRVITSVHRCARDARSGMRSRGALALQIGRVLATTGGRGGES